jgi:hypothetical protein
MFGFHQMAILYNSDRVVHFTLLQNIAILLKIFPLFTNCYQPLTYLVMFDYSSYSKNYHIFCYNLFYH